MVPELFPRVNIAYMNFDRRKLHRFQRIADGHTGVRVGRRIDDDSIGPVEERLPDPVDQRPFAVALKEFHLHLQFRRHLAKTRFDLRQCAGAVHFGLPSTKQMKIRTIDY